MTIHNMQRNVISTDIFKGKHRIASTAQWLWMHPDVTAYIYDEENDKMNLDPWTLITGIDRSTTEPDIFFLEFGQTGELKVDSEYKIYIEADELSKTYGRAS